VRSAKNTIPRLESSRLHLRAPEPEDLEILYNWENDTSTWLVSNTLTPFSKFVLRQYLETAHRDIFESKEIRLMIDLKTNQNNASTIGTIDMFDYDPLNMRAGIGILIAASQNRKLGYAYEALQMIDDYAFNILQLHQLYCNIPEDNIPSLNLFQKAGYEIVGIKKGWIRSGQQWLDEYMLQQFNPY
jgi:diamine N-acetyltransferase